MAVVIAIVCSALGGGAGWVLARMNMAARQGAVTERVRNLESSLQQAESELSEAITVTNEFRERNAALAAQLNELQNRRAEDEERLVAQFEKLSNQALRNTSEQLVQTAESTFKKAQLEAKGEIDQNRLKIEHLVEPMKENLSKLEKFVQDSNQERKQEFGGLREQMQQVAVTNAQIKQEAAQLKNVLRSSSAARGRWGEAQLRRIVELAGMVEHCDFTEQETASDSDRISRADLLITMPGGVKIAIDSKVPYEAFERAVNCDDADEQKREYIEHARMLRVAIDGLAKRKYWEMYAPSPGYCVLFVPGDGLLQTALAHDPTLWEHAFGKNVYLAAPSTLIPLLRMAAMQWQKQNQVDNAAEIAKTGRELYNRMMKMFSHFRALSTNLGRTVGSFNEMVGSYESRVMPQARKLKDLGVGDADEMIEIETVDAQPRTLRAETGIIAIESAAAASRTESVVVESFEEYWTAHNAK